MHNFNINENPENLSVNDFERLSKFVYDQCGIKMSPIKKTMLETRLRKRLKATGINSFRLYCDYVFSSKGYNEEIIHMIDVITTNKTDFFREPAQFTFLVQKAVPELLEEYGTGIEKKLKIWSAGCSTGEEPYTIAITLNEFKERIPGFNYSIFASDISTKVLETAVLGIYDIDRISPVSYDLKKKYFMKGKDSKKSLVRVIPELRKAVSFQRINFMDDDLGIREKFEIIFCRNVIIYFDKQTQEKIIRKLCSLLIRGGYLFLGHSETLFNIDIPVEQVAPSTYKKVK